MVVEVAGRVEEVLVKIEKSGRKGFRVKINKFDFI